MKLIQNKDLPCGQVTFTGEITYPKSMRSDIVPLLALLRAFGNNNIVDEFVAKYPTLK